MIEFSLGDTVLIICSPMSIEEWYKQLPIVTRTYVTLSFLTTAGCALEVGSMHACMG
jgi:hypothetical protein